MNKTSSSQPSALKSMDTNLNSSSKSVKIMSPPMLNNLRVSVSLPISKY